MLKFEDFLKESYSEDFYSDNKNRLGKSVIIKGKEKANSINLDKDGDFIAYVSNNKIVIEDTDNKETLTIDGNNFKQIIKNTELEGEISDDYVLKSKGRNVELTNTDEGDYIVLPLDCFKSLRKFGKTLL